MAYYPLATETGAIYKLVSPSGVTAVFNDPTDPNYSAMLTEVTGLDSAEVRESAMELVEADGGTHGNFYLGRRPITMSGRIFGHASVKERDLRMDRAKRASLALRGDASLTWKPSRRVENQIGNPRAVTDLNGWGTTAVGGMAPGATLARVTGVAPPVGTTALQVATTTSANQGIFDAITVVAGVTYYVSVACRIISGTGVPQVYIDGGGINAVLGSLTSGAAWVVSTFSFTPTVSGTVNLIVRDPSTSATTFQVSDVMVANANVSYFDGDSANYFWQGTDHASLAGDYIEMLTLVRRQQPFRETAAWNKEFQMALVSEYAAIYSAAQRLASAAGGASVSVENRGSWASSPILRITGTSAANPTITNATNSSNIKFLNPGTGNLIVASGEVLEIDTLNHTAYFTAGTRNGQSANRYLDFGGITNWLNLSTGTNSISMTGTGTLTVVWRDTWV